jgi:ribosomal protein S18 acetylase RimI-like enzyme
VLADVEQNHRSWFGRMTEELEIDGVTLFIGPRNAAIAFPPPGADPAQAVHRAIAAEVSEIGCWSLAPDERLGRRLTQLGFQDGWQPHWMGVDPRDAVAEYDGNVSESDECSDDVPYASPEHRAAIGGDVHHFVVRPARGEQIVGHAVLNVDGTTGGIYDMGVVAGDRRQGHGLALTTAAVVRARELGCTSVTLNATGEGEPMYRRAGFRSLGLGMTWWMPHR